MALTFARTGKRSLPPRLWIYGKHKVGKSTFAASIPKNLFLPFEEGLDAIVADALWQDRPGRCAESAQDLWEAIYQLRTEPHEFQALTIDTLDWLEPHFHKEVCLTAGKQDIDAVGGGFQKGQKLALKYWRLLTEELDKLRRDRGMAVILLAHAAAKRFESPDVAPYDRWEPKIDKLAAAVLAEWVDVIGYADFETAAVKAEEHFGKDVRLGVATGRRILRLGDRASSVCGNRYSLPSEIPFSWEAFSMAYVAAQKQAEKVASGNG